MNTSVDVEARTEFGADAFRTNAVEYAANKRIVDAASKYDNLDDAIATLQRVWESLEVQAANGAKYTPAAELGFGSDSASVIAESILGRRSSVAATRKAFANLGK
jgi:succinate dehydrogenase/fumarate reductase flavoprotein subunit